MNKILYLSLFFAIAAYGQQERIAIMNTVDDRDSIAFLDLSYLTDKLRDIASKILPKDHYGIMTQQSIVDRLGSQERAIKECKEATCLADLGRKISADYIAQGHVGRFSGKLTIKTELYRVGNSNLIGAFTGDSENLQGLLYVLEEKAPKLFEDMIDSDKEKPVPLVPEQPPPVKSTSNLADAVDAGYKAPKKIYPQMNTEEYRPSNKSNKSFWIALPLDIVGAGSIFYGYLQDKDLKDKDLKGTDKTAINACYILGFAFLAAGIGVHIWF